MRRRVRGGGRRARRGGARVRRGRVSGRGHGLAVASAVAASHGGRIAAAPSERGARIVLALPACAGVGRSAPGCTSTDARRRASHSCTPGGRNRPLLQLRAQPVRGCNAPCTSGGLTRAACRTAARPSGRRFSGGRGEGREDEWRKMWQLGCKVGDRGLQWAPHAEPGWQGSSHPATRVQNSQVRQMSDLELPRNLRTLAGRQAPAHGAVEVPRGTGRRRRRRRVLRSRRRLAALGLAVGARTRSRSSPPERSRRSIRSRLRPGSSSASSSAARSTLSSTRPTA